LSERLRNNNPPLYTLERSCSLRIKGAIWHQNHIPTLRQAWISRQEKSLHRLMLEFNIPLQQVHAARRNAKPINAGGGALAGKRQPASYWASWQTMSQRWKRRRGNAHQQHRCRRKLTL
jgi:hypothetical protein